LVRLLVVISPGLPWLWLLGGSGGQDLVTQRYRARHRLTRV